MDMKHLRAVIPAPVIREKAKKNLPEKGISMASYDVSMTAHSAGVRRWISFLLVFCMVMGSLSGLAVSVLLKNPGKRK